MNKTKFIGYAAAFFVGGITGGVSQGIMNLYIHLNIPNAVLWMIFTVALIGAILVVPGLYQKIENFAGMGTAMPMCGLSGSIAAVIAAQKTAGASTGKAVITGLKGPFKIFGCSILIVLILAFVMKYLQIKV
jgi:hypothetical protein